MARAPLITGPIRAAVSSALCIAMVIALGPSAVAASGGTPLWVQRYNDLKNRMNDAYAVAASPDGSKVFVTGTSKGSGTYTDYATVAYDALSGDELWVSRYDGPEHYKDFADSIAVSPDGSAVFVTGYSYGVTTLRDYTTVAYDTSTGDELWVKRYDGRTSANDIATAIAASPDGEEVFVTGYSDGDYTTLAYDASTGAKVWVKHYNGPGDTFDEAFAVAASPDGSEVFVTGASTGSQIYNEDYATVAYEASTGTRLWVRRYNGPGNDGDAARAIVVSPDSSKVFVTGESTGGPTTGTDYATLAYDATTGTRLWLKRYDGPGINQNGDDYIQDYATSIAVSPDGSAVFVTGYGDGLTTLLDYETVAYDASTGTRLWVSRYDGPANHSSFDEAFSLAVSPDGSKVFVTGASYGGSSTGDDYATVAYDPATGTRLWVSRYDGPDHLSDGARSVAVSSDGSKVFVTGKSDVSTTGSDYATVAYAA